MRHGKGTAVKGGFMLAPVGGACLFEGSFGRLLVDRFMDSSGTAAAGMKGEGGDAAQERFPGKYSRAIITRASPAPDQQIHPPLNQCHLIQK